MSATAPPAPLDLTLNQRAGLKGQVDGFDPTQRQAFVRLYEPALFPNGDPISETTTDDTGAYQFDALDAPTSYVVAVYGAANAANPLDSIVRVTEPSEIVTVPTFTVRLP